MLDVLASSCLQLCELRGVDASDMMDSMGAGAGTNKLFSASAATTAAASPVNGNAAVTVGPLFRIARTPDPGAAAVEYWRAPEHSGWLFKKGEHLSTWRKRWFILKDGRLFWFASDKGISPAVKPRGILTLKACPGARAVTLTEAGKPYALELQGPDALATGCKHLAADSEVEKDAWVAALSRAVAAAACARGAGGGTGAGRSHEEWAAQLREGMNAISAVSSVPSPRQPAPVVQIAGYDGGYSGPPSGSATGWEVHYNETGRAFYYDPRTGRTQWDPPAGFA